MKKKQYNLFNKLRAALRDIYRYSPMRREAIKAVSRETCREGNGTCFECPICGKDWPIQMADVDHEPPLGAFTSLNMDENGERSLGSWAQQLFYGKVQVICKLCHKKKSASQRRKSVKN